MSWSVSRCGTKDAVKTAVADDLDRCAANYKGQEEEKDVMAAKERILAACDRLKLDPDYSQKTPYGVEVSANGSQSDYQVTITVTVTRKSLVT